MGWMRIVEGCAFSIVAGHFVASSGSQSWSAGSMGTMRPRHGAAWRSTSHSLSSSIVFRHSSV